MLLVQADSGHLPVRWRMWRAPESPRWLDQQNRHDEALHILKQIRPAERAQKEYDDISTLIKIGSW
ncbi:MFS transporter [Klebsiella pneumoniae subsp. pneumoniae]|nr:MFS transporter [Klebsiella pneumoniae subsp. pneumoniae]